jgi:hypothetical protein
MYAWLWILTPSGGGGSERYRRRGDAPPLQAFEAFAHIVWGVCATSEARPKIEVTEAFRKSP